MINDDNFETFLFISDERISISIKTKNEKDKLYENSTFINNFLRNTKLSELDEFLNLNIIKIEKSIQKFINKVILIIDHQDFLKISLSVKKKFYGNLLDKQSLSSLLNDARNQVYESNKDKIITHMVIDKYQIDGKFFSFLPDNIRCQNLCLDINFVCFSENSFMKIKESLSRYQIEIKHILSASYLRNIFEDDTSDIYSMGQKILDGYNNNEILLIPKIKKNKGFFEKFFNFFN